MKSFHTIFMGDPRGESHHEGVPVMVGVVAVLATLTIAMSLLLQLPYSIVVIADSQRPVVTQLISLLLR